MPPQPFEQRGARPGGRLGGELVLLLRRQRLERGGPGIAAHRQLGQASAATTPGLAAAKVALFGGEHAREIPPPFAFSVFARSLNSSPKSASHQRLPALAGLAGLRRLDGSGVDVLTPQILAFDHQIGVGQVMHTLRPPSYRAVRSLRRHGEEKRSNNTP